MRIQNRKICLFVDNFSGHEILYEPSNIQLEWFEPNLTPYVQPLDAGIIRCFKAHYRRAFCIRALDRDDAGEQEIYKISLLEAMLMAKEAWDSIEPTTIKHCWDHTAIQRPPIMLRIPATSHNNSAVQTPPTTDPITWQIIRDFATTEMTLPDAEDALKRHLGENYHDDEWLPVLQTVMDADEDGNSASALAVIDKIKPTKPPGPSHHAVTAQGQLLESEISDAMIKLKKRNRVHGELLSMDELLKPVEEDEVGESPEIFEGGDEEIVAEVCREHARAEEHVAEAQSESDDEQPASTALTRAEMMDLCERLETSCLDVDAECALDLKRSLCRFRAHLRKVEMASARQITLNSLWGL